MLTETFSVVLLGAVLSPYNFYYIPFFVDFCYWESNPGSSHFVCRQGRESSDHRGKDEDSYLRFFLFNKMVIYISVAMSQTSMVKVRIFVGEVVFLLTEDRRV